MNPCRLFILGDFFKRILGIWKRNVTAEVRANTLVLGCDGAENELNTLHFWVWESTFSLLQNFKGKKKTVEQTASLTVEEIRALTEPSDGGRN